jgi:hypothetical protein
MEADKVLFNASSAGALLTEKQGAKFTDVQKLRILELEKERDTGLNANGNKVKWEGTKKPDELAELIAKRDAPPELSDTAKALVRKVWLRNEKGIYSNIKSKFLDKGIMKEEDSISLVSEVEGVLYVKNEERIKNEYFSGECDIVKDFENKRLIIDTKTSWSAETFMDAKPTLDYEIQGQIYMELWDADEFELKFVLVDAPDNLVQREKDLAKWKYFSGDMTDEELNHMEELMSHIYEQIERNMIYSNNERITKEECIKTFYFKRDKEIYAKLVEKVKLARQYYKTLSLNHKH